MLPTTPTTLSLAEGIYRISNFIHTPLNHFRPSIRVFKVLPDLSQEGLLQCDLANGTVNDKFTCLSYTWGEECAARPILVNRQLFLVRQNLWNFLNVARNMFPSRPFWIDAVCIDQNSISERNHQVAQMGVIYAAAAHVIVWLGSSKPIADFFRVWKECYMIKSGPFWWNETKRPLLEVELGWNQLGSHDYWTRAWITQEISYARNLSLLASNVELDRRLLKYIAKIPWYTHKEIDLDVRYVCHIDVARGRRLLRGKPLFTLLEELPNQHCQVLRDRVYSLLGLAAEGSNIQVDYSSSELDFVCNVMKACERSAGVCSLELIAKVLDLRSPQTLRISNPEIRFVELDLQPCQLSRYAYEVVLPPKRQWYMCDHCGSLSAWETIGGEVFRLSELCPRLASRLYLETSWADEHEDDDLKGRFRLGGDVSDTHSDWFSINMQPKFVNGLRLFTLRLGMSILLSLFLKTDESVKPQGGTFETIQLCQSAKACQGALRIEWDRSVDEGIGVQRRGKNPFPLEIQPQRQDLLQKIR
jgi:hypothetical protein